MSGKIIITLIGAFVITCFSVFNNTLVAVDMCSFKTLEIPLSIFTFFTFLCGGIYAGIISIQEQIELKLKIRMLQKKLRQFQSIHRKNEPCRNHDNDDRIPEKTVSAADMDADDEIVKTLHGENDDHEPVLTQMLKSNNSSVPQTVREFALQRIKQEESCK